MPKPGEALRQVLYLVGSQLASRVFTFLLNALVARQVGLASYGLSTVNMYLLDAIILTLAREGMRRAGPRFELSLRKGESIDSSSFRERRRKLVNLLWLCVPVGLVVSIVCIPLFLYRARDMEMGDGASYNAYSYALCMTAISSILQLIAEPFWVISDNHILFDLRARSEAYGVMGKCITTYICVVFLQMGVLSFGVGSLAFGSLYLFVYVSHFIETAKDNQASLSRHTPSYSPSPVPFQFFQAPYITDLRDVFPSFSSFSSSPSPSPSPLSPSPSPSPSPSASPSSSSPSPSASSPSPSPSSSSPSFLASHFDPDMTRLALSFSSQSLMKLFLTEGEKVVLVSFSSNTDTQGIYGLVHNLGSLVARFLFLPLEQSSFSEFNTTMKTHKSNGGDKAGEREKDKGEKEEEKREKGEKERESSDSPNLSQLEAGLRLLGLLLKTVVLIGLVFVSFGPNFSFVLIHIIYGHVWSSTSAPLVLSVYCVYVLCIAVNGVSEAFLFAIIPQSQVKSYNKYLFVFSCVYLAASALLLRYGPVGIILVNCVNMLARVIYTSTFVIAKMRRLERERELRSLFFQHFSLSPFTLLAFASSFSICWFSFGFFSVSLCPSVFCFIPHIGVGFVLVVVVAATVYLKEKAFLSSMRSLSSHKPTNKSD